MSKTIGLSLAAAALLAGCGGGGGGGGRNVLMQGGTGDYGGDGGLVYFYTYTGGNLEVRRGGSVDTHFDLPQNINPYLGINPRTITGNKTFEVGTDLAIGDDTILGDDDTDVATGLWIQKGATLTINPNCSDWDCSSSSGLADRIVLSFSDGVLIEGTLILGGVDVTDPGDALGDEPARLRWNNYPANLVITKDGSVNGDAKAACANAAVYIHLYANGTVVNQGTVSAVGGNCTDGDGGNGGEIALKSDDVSVFNTGDLTSSGGSSSSDYGGDAGDIYIYTDSSYGGAYNSGHLVGAGGTGKLGGGNGAEYIEIYNDGMGDVINSGDIDCPGGDGTSSADDADGGDGCYYVGIYGYNGDVLVSGKLNAKGANGAGDGDGGNSANDYSCCTSYYGVQIAGYSETSLESSEKSGRVWVSMDMDIRGGDAGTGTGSGGDGGFLVNDTDYDGYARPFDNYQSSVKYFGYDNWNWSGGDGRVDGGSVYDDSTFFNAYTSDADGNYWMGAMITETDFTGRGGNGTDGAGGCAYYFELDQDYDVPAILNSKITGDIQYLLNNSKIDLSSGNGKTSACDGGNFYSEEDFKLENHGTVVTNGGSCTGSANCNGGDAGYIEWYSDGKLLNTAEQTSNGGAGTGTGTGGNGYEVILDSRDGTKTTANLTSTGGSATGTDLGGEGGYIEVLTTSGVSDASGKANVAAGSKAPDDSNGDVFVDGINIVNSSGTADL